MGDRHLLPPEEDEVLLPPDQLGHLVEGYPAWQGQRIHGEFLFDPPAHPKARGGSADVGGGVHYLLGFPYLLV